jgi:hypothetical protein
VVRRLSVISLFVGLLLMAGCSRTVTSYVNYGSSLTVEVNLRANLDVSKYRYFIVFSTQEAISFPIQPPEGTTLDEFLEPGDAPRVGDNTSYFANYYSTWTSYIVLTDGGYFLAKGPFIATNTVTREPLAPLSAISNKLSFNVNLTRLFGTTIPDTIYFDIIAVDYPTNDLKYLKDHAGPPIQRLAKISGSILSGTNTALPDIDGALNFTTWWVRVD